jgi:ABC-type dipeptide/oligopeptide/nickel transport system permease subunit
VEINVLFLLVYLESACTVNIVYGDLLAYNTETYIVAAVVRGGGHAMRNT